MAKKKTVKKTVKKATKKVVKKAPATTAKPGAKAAKKTGDRKFRKLSNVEHVRMRTGMWLGQNSLADISQHFFLKQRNGHYNIEHDELRIIPAVWKCLDEACMNCIDEYRKNLSDAKIPARDRMKKLEVSLSDDRRTLTIEDNGRGIPMANAEGVFLHLMYGENFDDMAQSDHVAGQNGVGVSLVRMVSESFRVVSCNKGQEYTRVFTVTEDFHKLLVGFKLPEDAQKEVALYYDTHGNIDDCPELSASQKEKCRALMAKNLMSGRVKKCPPTRHGVKVELRLASQYFNKLDTSFMLKLFRQYLQDLAMTNPGLKVVLNHKKKSETFQFTKGMEEIFAESDMVYYKMAYKDAKSASKIDMNAFVVIGQNKTLTWVNSNFASLGGTPIEYLANRICDEIRKKPTIQSLEKKLKTSATRNDVRNCFHMYIDLRVLNPRFKSQDKSYLINDLNEEMRLMVDKNLDKLIRKTDLINEVKTQMERRTQLKALEDAEKGLRRASRVNIPKLISATGKASDEGRILFIAEGDSAIAGLRPARDPKLHGLFPLKGKPLNVKDMSLAKAMANDEMKNIVAILGLPLNEKVKDASELKYDKLSIITDADFDGYAIRSLMLSFFYEYWPELFNMGVINITAAPLYEVDVQDLKSKKKEVRFCIDDAAYNKLQKEVDRSNLEIVRKKRNKGLGESSVKAMKFAIAEGMIEIKVGATRESNKIQELWFHKQKAEDRRKAISSYTGTIYDDN